MMLTLLYQYLPCPVAAKAKKSVFLLLLFAFQHLIGQDVVVKDTAFVFVKTVQKDVRLMEVDKLGRLYLLTEKNQVVVTGLNGTARFAFSGKNIGPIDRIDATDPMNILASSAEFQQLVILDRTLNPIAELGYYDLGLQQVGAVGMSNLNAIWAFDVENYRLKCFDAQGRVLRESNDLSQLLGLDFAPTFLLERDGNIYMTGNGQPVAVFDGFGNYLRSLDIKPSGGIQFYNGHLYYLRDGQFFQYDLTAYTEMSLPLPAECKNPSQVLVMPPHLYVRTGAEVSVYEIR